MTYLFLKILFFIQMMEASVYIVAPVVPQAPNQPLNTMPPPAVQSAPPLQQPSNEKPLAEELTAEMTEKPAIPRTDLGYKSEILEGFYEEFIYNTQDRRDPFSLYTPKRGTVEIVSELQKFGVEQLNIIGIMWNVSIPKALVLDPNGKHHLVKENDRVGTNNGYIAKIREGEVIVIEEQYDEEGTRLYQAKSLILRKEETK